MFLCILSISSCNFSIFSSSSFNLAAEIKQTFYDMTLKYTKKSQRITILKGMIEIRTTIIINL